MSTPKYLIWNPEDEEVVRDFSGEFIIGKKYKVLGFSPRTDEWVASFTVADENGRLQNIGTTHFEIPKRERRKNALD